VSSNVGSFGAILTREQIVPDFGWTKIVFDEAEWDTGGHLGLRTGSFTAERGGKHHFAAGMRLLIPVVPYCAVELMLYMNGEPRLSLTRETPLARSCCSVLLSSRTHQVELARGFTVCEIVAETGDAFEVYIRHDGGEQAHLTPHYSDAADRSALVDRHPTYFIGVRHASAKSPPICDPAGGVDEQTTLPTIAVVFVLGVFCWCEACETDEVYLRAKL
jgi:hypothetical protein